jgi:hypothetical protein
VRRFLLWLRQRKAAASRDRTAIERAMKYFRATHDREPMDGCVLRRDGNEAVVRVMYYTNHVPPDRAWFVVSDHQGAVREVSREEAGDTAVWR